MSQQQFLLCLNGRLTLPFDLLFPGVSQSTNICTNVACNIKWLTQLNLANLLRRIYLIFCHTFMYDCMSFDYNYRCDYTGQPFKRGYCGRNSCCCLYYSYTHHHYRHHHCILQVSRCHVFHCVYRSMVSVYVQKFDGCNSKVVLHQRHYKI